MSRCNISVIIPIFNENPEVAKNTVYRFLSLQGSTYIDQLEIVVVDDGSTKFSYLDLWSDSRVVLIKHPHNRGYGASLLTGIKKASFEKIVICDSDGTYEIEKISALAQLSADFDMVIGTRSWKDIDWLRKPVKQVLHKFASFLAGQDVIDLNSGFRLFPKSLVFRYQKLFPERFSFTSTLTMLALTNSYRVASVPIEYGKRIGGKSKIHPLKDTVMFFSLVSRLSLYFNPLRVFVPSALFFLFAALMRGLRDYQLNGHLGGLCLVLFLLAFQIFFFGLLAEIVNKRSA